MQDNKELYFTGIKLYNEKKYQKALKVFEELIHKDPQNGDSFANISVIKKIEKKYDEAFKYLNSAIKINPKNSQYHTNMGNLFRDVGSYKNSIDSYLKAIEINPEDANTFNNLAITYEKTGDENKAIEYYKKAIIIDNTMVKAINNIGILLYKQKKYQDAIDVFDLALKTDPEYYDVYSNKGSCLSKIKEYDKAIEQLKLAIKYQPNNPGAYTNLGNVYHKIYKYNEAIQMHEKSLSLNDKASNTHANLANSLKKIGLLKEAILSYKQSLQIDPNSINVHFDISTTYLMKQDFINGWKEYEWRFKKEEMIGHIQKYKNIFEAPLFTGQEDIKYKTLLVHSEQGFGDSIQFVRFASLLTKKYLCKVILSTREELVSLFTGLKGINEVVSRENVKAPSYDYQIALMSLPYLLKMSSFKDIPSKKQYLFAPKEQTIKIKKEAGFFYVGITWSASVTGESYDGKVFDIKYLEPLLKNNKIIVYSLQVGPESVDIKNSKFNNNIIDRSNELKSFNDTASLIDQLDLVISSDTSVAHLAGALNKEVWVPIQKVPDWRWTEKDENSNWYESAKLFKQEKNRQWQSVFDKIFNTLDKKLNKNIKKDNNEPKLNTTTSKVDTIKSENSANEKVDTDNSKNRLLLSLKYILDFYYGSVSVQTILNFTPNTSEGFTNDMVIDVANEMGLNSIEKDMKASQVANYFFPCIVIDKAGEAFILVSKANREATLINAKTNESIVHNIKHLDKYQKVILIFRDQKKSEFIEIDKNKNWFWGPVKSFWRSYIEIGLLTFFINIFALAIPLFTMSVYDRVVPNNAIETLFVLAGGIVIILLFDLIFKSARNHIIEKTGKKLGMFFEDELMKRMLSIRSGYDNMLIGMKASLFRELGQVKDFFAAKSIVQVIDFPFFFLGLLIIYVISPAVAAVPLSIAFIIIVLNIILQIPISSLSKDRMKNMQTKQSYLVELIQGTEMIKFSNAVPTKLFNWRNIVAFSDSITMKIQSINVFSTNISQTMMQLLTVAVIVVGVNEISNNNLTIGGLIAVTILSTRAMVPIVQMSGMIVRFKEIKESLNIVSDFWHLPLETHKQIEIGLEKLKGDIEFKDVSFFYDKSKYASIDKINLKIKAGERVGIIGQTGAGKSTILRMLSALEVPSTGSIFLDSHDLNTIHPVELRQNIGVMPQEPFLFNGSLKENIELSAPISKEKMMEVIKMIGLEPLVKKSGQGDGVQVGEGGKNLSVGQRHLVALARAIVNNPSILILDEPTTGLDIGLEKALVDKMEEIVENKTLIVITHRFTALDLVDRVIVLNEGKIVADGPKDKILLALQGKKI